MQLILCLWLYAAVQCVLYVTSLAPPAGESGMGRYHGQHGFDNLSHMRGVLLKQLKMEAVNKMRYPPHTADKLGWARFFMVRHVDFGSLGRMAVLALLVVFAAVIIQVTHHQKYYFLSYCSSQPCIILYYLLYYAYVCVRYSKCLYLA